MCVSCFSFKLPRIPNPGFPTLFRSRGYGSVCAPSSRSRRALCSLWDSLPNAKESRGRGEGLREPCSAELTRAEGPRGKGGISPWEDRRDLGGWVPPQVWVCGSQGACTQGRQTGRGGLGASAGLVLWTTGRPAPGSNLTLPNIVDKLPHLP